MKRLFRDTFQDKKILVTGHTGFIGSWLSIWLNELGAKVIGYALPPYTNNDNFVVTNLQEKIEHHIGDIRDYHKLNSVFKKYNPEIIFHLAAQSLVRKSYFMPKETYDVNVGGTVNVFEAFKNNNISRVLINITTDKCYENRECIEGYNENDRLGGYDPYSSSKACSELITSAYRDSFFKSFISETQKIVTTVRSGNIIGGGDWQEDRLIPDCMKAIMKNQDIIIRNPNSIRPWQYVLEPIRGYFLLAGHLLDGNEKFSGAWNFGSGNNFVYSVKEIVEKIIQTLGKGSYTTQSSQESNNLHETKVLLLDCRKSKKLLKWNPIMNIDDMIEFVCEWYSEVNINYDFDVNQINKYLKNCE